MKTKRHVHMLDLDSPSHPRLRRSSCKDCVFREEEVERLRAEHDAAMKAVDEAEDKHLDLIEENERLRVENQELTQQL